MTKIQSIVLVTMIIIAITFGIITYILFAGDDSSSETIKIGFIGDLRSSGIYGLRGVEWAVEQINAEGGVLGRLLEVFSADSDYATSGGDATKSALAMERLITYHKVDFIIGAVGSESSIVCQDTSAIHNKIFINAFGADLIVTQRVAEDYDKYKYFFRYYVNQTVSVQTLYDSLETLSEYSGFNKVALISDYFPSTQSAMANLELILSEKDNVEIVYKDSFAPRTVDFSSYFAGMEAAGAEIIVPYMAAQEGVAFTKEWYHRQSPTVMWGINLRIGTQQSWDGTEGQCDFTTHYGNSFNLGYPLTNKTLPIREAYIERFSEDPTAMVSNTYDAVRFILIDALKRAGTTETNEVLNALEKTNVETSIFPLFVFTSNHDYLQTENVEEDTRVIIYFQWQNGALVPVYPKGSMVEAGATYTYPDWPGPWDE